MPEPIDTMAPWTIKSVSTATKEAVIKAARQEGLTVGQWLERRVAEWTDAGSPVRKGVSYPVANPVSLDLMQLAQLARALTPPDRDSAAMRLARSIVRERLLALQAPTAPAEPAGEPAQPVLAARKPQAALPRS